ncbi:hypothetical protein [Streptomyces sp. NPDC029003]|uniref:hypothetical protein n=1 Tax=Streptomyces sp. NPDC029003 TaxID=3155125 RepID=UPI0033E90736
MPGQRKRKRGQYADARQAAAPSASGAGRWEVLFETQDEAEWRAHIHRLRASGTRTDWTLLRMDTFCGRLIHPTTYRLSRFVPNRSLGPGRKP